MVGENIKELRERAGLTQQELADKCGVGRTFIAQIERGAKLPSLMLADDLARLFGCSIDELIAK